MQVASSVGPKARIEGCGAQKIYPLIVAFADQKENCVQR